MIFNSPQDSIKGVLNYLTKLPFTKYIVHKLSEAARGKCVVFFSLHRLLDESTDFANHPHYLNKTALTPSQFHQIISQIKKTLQFISLNESLDILTGKQPTERSYAVLIIDVPYEQTLLLIEPVLHELKIPACVMLNTEQLKTRSMPWADELVYKMGKTGLKEVICGFFDRTLMLQTESERLDSAAHAIGHLNHCDYDTFCLRLQQLRKILADVVWPPPTERMASLAKLKKYGQKKLWSFGCAGRIRLPFFKIGQAEAYAEIVEATQELRDIFGDALSPIFSYQSGLYRRKDKTIANTFMEAGLMAAISDKNGVCRPGDNMFRLRRLPLAAGNSFEKFELQGLANAIDEFLLVSLAQEKKY